MKAFDSATQLYFDLLESLQQAVITTDAAGLIIHWSQAAEVLYGWKAADVAGQNILEITPSDISRSQAADIMQALGRGEVWSGQFRVRARDGEPFIASVTDVPLLNDARDVVGIIGVSARAQSPTNIHSLMTRFAAACQNVWPNLIAFDIGAPMNAAIAAAEPHIIQLLSLLILLYADVLDQGAGVIEVLVGDTDQSPFADFGLASGPSNIYVRIGRRGEQPSYSVLRSLSHSSEPTRFASALVRMVGGRLITSGGPNHLKSIHLFLPVQS